MLCSLVQASRRGAILGLLALAITAGSALAQAGSIAGTVRNQFTSAAISGARVNVVGTNLTAISGTDGRFQLANIPPGTYEVRALGVGFKSVSVTNVQVAGLPVTVNFELQPAVVSLEEVVITGTVGETQRSKLAFTVEQVKAVDIPVPQENALSQLQGKIAGAIVMSNTGRPGAAPTVLLRGATSIDASGRSQEPLYVVDGVILGSNMVDLDALDIESIEVVKGAAAASLYGSRASSGVIQIRTRRGAQLGRETVQFTVRTEYGANQLPGAFDLPQHHQFQMNASGTKFISGTLECDWLDCPNAPNLAGQLKGTGSANEWNTFQDQPWPGSTYDQVNRFFTGGNVAQQYLSAEGRSGGTNFHASWTNLRQEGVMRGQEGQNRNTFRVNVDQALSQKFELGASAFYSNSKEDRANGGLFDLTRMPAGVDLLALNACPATGACSQWRQPRLLPSGQQDPNDVWLNPDPYNNESPNPLYSILNDNNFAYRSRFLGSASLRFQALSWLSLDAQASYDRLDYRHENYVFKGYKTINPSAATNLGNLERRNQLTQALNASANATIGYQFGDLSTRTQFRYLAEYDEYEYTEASGNRFVVADVPTLDNLNPTTITAESGLQPVRADGFFAISNWEFKERYIIDGLIRNDGSSLFGPNERRQWYYRLAGAWRAGMDLNIPGVDELKLRSAYGTAGGRPRFTAQYETYSVSSGQVSPITLGNRDLKPEFSKELESGVDLLMGGRIGLSVNYATTTTEDQILQVPLPAFAGFTSQWRNAGTLESKTWEATLDLALVQARNVSWSAKVLFDRTRSTITQLDVPPFTYGVAGQELGEVFYAREGEEIGTFYGIKYATSCADLLGAGNCSDFAVNDDGLLVWVGPGGSLSTPQWGTAGPSLGFKGQNQALSWGSPIIGWGLDRVTGDTTNYLPIGKTMPDFHAGLSNSLRWGGLSLYGLLEWTQGISVYNQPQQWAVFRSYAGVMDQADKADVDKKPLGYYNRLYGVAGLRPVNYFVQDASFAKLREVSLSYRFNRDQLASIGFLRAFQSIGISLIGRNLLTFSDYNGYDPEVGRGEGDTGSAAIARVDGYDYPNFRTITAALQVTF